MNIIYCKSNTVTGFLIRLFTFSRWNHVAIEHNGRVIDATGMHGVANWSAREFKDRYKNIYIEKLKHVNEGDVWSFLMSQVGKPYDYTAIVAFPFRKNWQSTDAWFCSELVATAVRCGGRSLKLPSNRVTPRDLWVSL